MTPADDAAPVRPLDKEALKAKYRAERDKRLRADGNDQYIRAISHALSRISSPST